MLQKRKVEAKSILCNNLLCEEEVSTRNKLNFNSRRNSVARDKLYENVGRINSQIGNKK